jgi:alkylation response protein AidB-like acyl-CoA dehydrogenase
MNPQEMVAPVADDILAMADDAESERRLPDKLMAKLTDAGLFAIYTPRQFGGMGLALPDALRVVEEVAKYDGSTAWVVALGFANDLFTSAIPADSAAQVLGRGSALIAGAPGMMVQARAVDGGYWLTGQWQYASGVPNADWVSVAAPVFDGDTPRGGPAGPEMIFAFLPPSDVEIVDTWHVSGLCATGSHDVRANGAFVPAEMTGVFALPAGPRALRDCTAARIPFFTALGIAQAPPVCLGVARHAIEEFKRLAATKDRPLAGGKLTDQPRAQAGVARAEALLESARAYWYETVRGAWQAVSEGCQLSLLDRTRIRLACLTAAENASAATDLVYRLAGSSAIFRASPLERCWRDVHAAAQHMSVQDARWETAGRILLGMDPGSMVI